MKKFSLLLAVVIVITMLFYGCIGNSADVKLKSGGYLAEERSSKVSTADQAITLQPYVSFDTDEKTFIYGQSPMSYAEYGSYIIEDGKLIATAQNENIYTFEIEDENTLVMIGDDGEIIDEFVYNDDIN